MKRAGYTFSARYAPKVRPYADALRAAALDPVAFTPDATPALETVDALVICGGTDVDAALYGELRAPRSGDPDTARDAMEARLIRDAIARGVPLLCICRGMQLFNVVHGGTLHQHVEGHLMRGVPDAHTVTVEPVSLLASIVQAAEYPVNSRHHQTVNHVGRGLVVAARAAGGVVEALELPHSRFALAVQWHPEDRIGHDARDLALFRALAEAA